MRPHLREKNMHEPQNIVYYTRQFFSSHQVLHIHLNLISQIYGPMTALTETRKGAKVSSKYHQIDSKTRVDGEEDSDHNIHRAIECRLLHETVLTLALRTLKRFSSETAWLASIHLPTSSSLTMPH